MVTTQEHIAITLSMLEHAEEFLRAGDLVQASEKGWGAAAHYLKAVAKQRGWQNGSHRDFFTIKDRLGKDRLADETINPARFDELFGIVRGLHSNFYEPLYSDRDVATGIAAANEFVDTLNNAGVFDGWRRERQATD